MIGSHRLRRLAPLGVAAVLALALAACAQSYPNTTFTPHSDLGRSIDFLWDRLMFFGTIVFVLVEGALLYVVIRYRRRSEDVTPPQTHGHVLLEITWTLIPAAILVFIAVPTVRTIFQTQAPAPANSLVIEVYGHQWWWEFRYPQYKFTTANEIYIPKGRTVDLVLHSQDVIHSFWVPQLAGKRDAIPNHTNHIWFTPDTNMATTVWNGFCTEYCGDSHGEMHFRVVTVNPDQFASWVTRQQAPGFFSPPPAPAAPQLPRAPAAVAAATSTAATTTAGSTNAPATRGYTSTADSDTGTACCLHPAARPGTGLRNSAHAFPRRSQVRRQAAGRSRGGREAVRRRRYMQRVSLGIAGTRSRSARSDRTSRTSDRASRSRLACTSTTSRIFPVGSRTRV